MWLALVAGFIGATFDEDDLGAIDAGIRDTNVEDDRWFDYAFGASPALDIKVALDPGSSVVFVHAALPPGEHDLAVRVETTTEILKEWKLAKRTTGPQRGSTTG
ncbi:MAG: hypothetical protein RIF41_11960 [Polyangiaceae bacterium]